jgi:hypothetical protein
LAWEAELLWLCTVVGVVAPEPETAVEVERFAGDIDDRKDVHALANSNRKFSTFSLWTKPGEITWRDQKKLQVTER